MKPLGTSSSSTTAVTFTAGAGSGGLQDADAEDVAQEILLKLARKLRDFAYDPKSSFRGWLKTVAHHAWRDFVDGRSRARPAGDEHDLGAAAIGRST